MFDSVKIIYVVSQGEMLPEVGCEPPMFATFSGWETFPINGGSFHFVGNSWASILPKVGNSIAKDGCAEFHVSIQCEHILKAFRESERI